MIVQGEHPTEHEKHEYAPRVYSSEDDAWNPMDQEPTFDDLMDAARECLEYVRDHWEGLVREIRVLRCLCEHPGLDMFDADGVSADLLRDKAREVVERAGSMEFDLEYLLSVHVASPDEPEPPGMAVVVDIGHAETEPGDPKLTEPGEDETEPGDPKLLGPGEDEDE